MPILHGIWTSKTFYLWGEWCVDDSPDGNLGSDHASERQSAKGRHPRALTGEPLHATAGELSPDGLLASIAGETELSLWLPTKDDEPLPSKPLEPHPKPRPEGEVRLQAWTVSALAFSPADTVDFLTGLTVGALGNCGVSLHYWRVLVRFALSLLEHKQFVPILEEKDTETFYGAWHVFVTDRRAFAWLEQFVSAMPPVCRAVVTGHEAGRRPARLVDSFIAETTQAVIRRSLANDEFFAQIHERAAREDRWDLGWLSSLLGGPRDVPWGEADGTLIAGQVRSWIGQLEQEGVDKPPKLSFTLVEPEADAPDDIEAGDLSWHVRLDLHAPDDGALLDITSVWQDMAEGPSIIGQHLINRSEHLRGELTRAANVFPALKRVFDSSSPIGVKLNINEAHAFIRESAPLLQAQGFTVHLPDWATRYDHRLGLELFVRPHGDDGTDTEVSLGALGLSNMLDFDWRIALGDTQLSMEEFEALMERESPLIRIRGQWVDVDLAAARDALKFVRTQPGGRLTLASAIRISAGAEELDTGLPILGLSGTSWISRLLNEASDVGLETIEQPKGFKGSMRPYQCRGLQWLAFLDRLGIGACLADDMGLGKTIQLIALLLHERREGRTIGPTLLFVPMSVVGNWHREVRRFAKSLRVLVQHGPDRRFDQAFTDIAGRHDLVITTYGLAHRDLDQFHRVRWHRIALDEAQKIKNPSANQTIAIRSIEATHRVALTGTPLENHLSELWSIMEMLNPGLLGSAASFRAQFAVPIEKMGDRQRADQLRRMIRPFMLRRLKNDPNVECDLPEKMEMKVFCNLTSEQAALYEQVVRRLLDEVDSSAGIRRHGLILATLTKLKQVCNHPAHFLGDGSGLDGRSGKCERIVEMLEEVIEEKDAALIFTQYKIMGELLQRLISERFGVNVPFLHGGTPAKKRDEMVQSFQDSKKGMPMFLLSLKAGGFGLNLNRANHVFHFDRWWNPAVELQATDRAHRIGQTRRVQVHKFVCIGTIEDRIDKLLTEKSALADRIVGSGDEWLTGLSSRELRDYLTLTPEAVMNNE